MRRSVSTALSSVSFSALLLAAAPVAAAGQPAPAPTPPPTTSPGVPQASDPNCPTNGAGTAADNCVSGEVETKSGRDVARGGNTADNAILVTGSRIRRPNLTSNVPVTSVSAEDLTSRGSVNVGDALNDLPSLRSTFNQSNSTRFIGTAGVNVLDLRGLGTSRTLVLVNGRRHVTYSPGDFLVDVNTIPTDLIERADIVTGGSSAVYGSDAVAGVVNFVLRRNFEGLKVRAQYGMSDKGDRGIGFVSVTGGRNFAENRGNIAFNAEYVNAEPLYFNQRNELTGALTGRCQFNASSFTTGETVANGNTNGVPDQSFFCGVRNANISNGGTVTALSPAGGCTSAIYAPGGSAAALGAARCLNPGTPQGVTRIVRFNPDGTACQDIPALDFRPFGSGNYIANPASTCAAGSTLRNTGQLAPGLKRYTGNVLAHFDISDALKPFFEAKFVRVDALQQGQPSFFQGTFPGFFGAGRGIRCDNPFLTAQNISTLQGVGRCAGGATSTETIPLARFNTDFGGREELIRRDTYRIVGGVTGTFNGDWNYEVSVNYGHLKSRQLERNDLQTFDINGNNAGFLNAIDAVRNSSGQIVCRVNQTTVTDPACVPINVLGEGAPSQAALNYVNVTSRVDSRASELDALAFVGGDSSQLFELPGGPIRFVIGGEYRRERASQVADPLSASGGTFFNAFATFSPPTFSVKEAYGEIEVPILKDFPFAKELTVNAAGRISHYNTSAGTTKAFNVSGTWAPIRDIRFRANYSRSVRVPTIGDLYSPAGQNFGFVADPCDAANIAGGQFRAANCAALGVPAGFVNTPANTQTIGFLSGGNDKLTPEIGKSLTLGAVITPRFLPGFSFTADYYRIRVKNLIATLGAQTILNQCVDLPTINNQFCQLLFPRNPDGTFPTPALLSSGVNFAQQKADGIDFEASYRRKFANGGRLDIHGILTKVIRRINFTDPVFPTRGDRIQSELGDPSYAANLTVGYGLGRFDLRYSLNYFSRATIGAYENYYSFQGRPPVNPDFTAEKYYPGAAYHAFKLTWDMVPKKYAFYIGIDNAFDKKPPLGILGTEGGSPYDAIGRYVYVGLQLDL